MCGFFSGDGGERKMKGKLDKLVFFLLSMLILFFIFRWALNARKSNSPYVSFPNKIETFK